MPEVGWASLGLVPTLDRGAMRRVGSQLDGAARGTGRRFSRLFGAALGVGVGAATVGLVKSSIQLEAAYSTTMRQIGVAANVPQKRLEKLDNLAQKLGADTIFSSKDAADAMLELAKNGITPAVIQAGALQSALTLAAAGDVPLDKAATTMGNALNAFGLKGKDAASVAAALAGAANASSASIESLAEGLQQSSAVASDAGLSVQETAAALAAFANAGISGSDAGTSLKTMLSRLVPQTEKSSKAMKKLGLKFTDAHGEFLPLADIAEQLQKKLKGLSDEERTTALNTIFGSDARRAATVLMNEGRDGIEKYTRATNDQKQAERLAQTQMEGTAGALERMSGSVETAKIQFGQGLAPVVEEAADWLAELVDRGDLESWGRDSAGAVKQLVEDYQPLLGELKELGQDLLPAIGTAMGVTRDALEIAAPLAADLVGAFNDLPPDVKEFLLAMAGGAVLGKKLGVGKLLFGKSGGGSGLLGGLVSKAKPVPVFVTNPGFGGGGGGKFPGVVGGIPGGAAGLGKLPKFAPFIPVGIGSAPGRDSLMRDLFGFGLKGSKDPLGFDPEAVKTAEQFKTHLSETIPIWLDSKAKANDYFTLVRNNKRSELFTTVYGWDVANTDARRYLETLLNIRSLHQETRLERSGGTPNARPGSGVVPRGVTQNFYGDIRPNDVKEFQTHLQRKAVSAATDGWRN